MVLFYKLIKIRNKYDFIVFLNSLFTLLSFTIEFNTLSGLYSFYSKQEAVASVFNLYANFKKFISDLIDYRGLNLKHRIPVCTRFLLNHSNKEVLSSPKSFLILHLYKDIRKDLITLLANKMTSITLWRGCSLCERFDKFIIGFVSIKSKNVF
uniref:Uncharacterized protein n=1 Tax=Ophiognomonia clavigignenti-juglandacearum TaxID=218668 RepID=A0A2C9DSD4_9PEZI|nr:hypothetical protein [Ophiognomonia clavigignenti-juglandacearum]